MDTHRKMEGLRVVRGPDWKWSNQDGGNGYIGTVIDRESLVSPNCPGLLSPLAAKLNEHKSEFYEMGKRQGWATVVWDHGHAGLYRVGHNNAYDLLVIDNAATGVSHRVECGECFTGEIKGFRWFCVECSISVCSSCYYNGRHNGSHTMFQRFDSADSEPVAVTRSFKAASNIPLKGISPGAMVRRGFHWENGDEDVRGNFCGFGIVKSPRNSMPPGWVRVEWMSGECFDYRLGALGKSEVQLAKPTTLGSFSPDNLPVLKPELLVKTPADEPPMQLATAAPSSTYLAIEMSESAPNNANGKSAHEASTNEPDSISSTACMLCATDDVIPGIIQPCGHSLEVICTACVRLVAACPMCMLRRRRSTKRNARCNPVGRTTKTRILTL